MTAITIDFNTITGKVKPMHAVNNGPLKKKKDQVCDNYDSYAAAGIPFARNHDAAFSAAYGGEHTVDVGNIFPNFDADPYDPASYDFTLTDEYIARTKEVGTETFYRLGNKIEHGIKKYGTLPPKDFHKWAVICEHIIAHMNGDFADGKHFGITYWEIWNEPDLDPDDSTNKRTWGGTKAQFFELYAIASRHLKEKFPELKIGGPALAHDKKWGEEFIIFCEQNKLPLDFFSWHAYSRTTEKAMNLARLFRDLLDAHGYEKTESILNEWNYVRNWDTEFVYSILQIIGIKGAAYTGEMMLRCQNSGCVDMLMYYDARPTSFNGLWNLYTQRELKGYFPFYFFNQLYRLGNTVKVNCESQHIHAVAAKDEKGNAALMLTYFTDEEGTALPEEITLDTGKTGGKLKLVDETHTNEELPFDGKHLVLQPNSVALITF